MKKILIIGLTLFGFTMSKAQDDDDKKFRFGLKVMPSINWLKIEDEKRFDKGGAGMKFGYGLITEFKLAGAAWFSTGFQIDYDGGRVDYKPASDGSNNFASVAGYLYNDNDGFLEVEDIDGTDATTLNKYDSYLLASRKYKSTFLTLPINLRLKTKEIGYITYYGNVGLLASIHLKTKADDEVYQMNSGVGNGYNPNLKANNDMNVSKDMAFTKFGFNIGGGIEFNVAGSTSFIAGINWVQGFTNYVRGDSKYNLDVAKTSSTGGSTRLEQKFTTQSIALTIGVLF